MYNKRRGFTLLEMIVAVGLFSIVALIALGTLLTATTSNRKSKTERISLDSIGFALDDITQNVRFGKNYDRDPSTATLDEGSSPIIALVGAAGMPVSYRFGNISGVGVIERDTGSGWVRMTDPSVNITGLSFFVRGNPAASPPHYPRIFVRVSGVAKNPDTKAETPFAFQTTITKRKAIAQ